MAPQKKKTVLKKLQISTFSNSFEEALEQSTYIGNSFGEILKKCISSNSFGKLQKNTCSQNGETSDERIL
jgi:hypothetical protein